MRIIRENFKQEEKKIKKHYEEQKMLDKIINHIKQCQNYDELKNSPISKMYGFEHLKYELNDYYGFNLCKQGGVIRLICSIDKENNSVKLEFISKKHYKDLKKR